jgi:prephenate dehydrogenase
MFNWLGGEMPVTPPDLGRPAGPEHGDHAQPAGATGGWPGRVAVLGLGLIGGSLLRRLAELGTPVTGYDSDPATRSAARDAGQSRVPDSVTGAVAGADLAVLAVPLPAAGTVLDELHAAGYAGLLTDVTSVKGPLLRLAAERCPGARWVGGHPMAGRESSGFAASDPRLFDGCAWVLCLDDGTQLAGWLRLAGLVTRLGARAVPATAAEHDAAVARISHAPHVVAAALAAGAAAGPAGPLALALGAGSYRDGTRVAATRPALTAAMCGGNAAALRAELDALVDRLAEARRLLDEPDPVAALTPWLAAGHATRSRWPAEPGVPERIETSADALLALGRAGGWITAVAADGATATAVRPRA